ncbi:hypothetical protein K435DRAFT_733265 [Dendrothele bispora CBS 962.96]|uniref:WD40 repeat-like protein n=1 Tax=Dendrothele bispora (strain CBS 962.96) TaxID=1314807 RepID=A0A4S8L6S1_DENBC|nr:hypothetical protein K435DRAFT_733265 [Dendrothele bispora CBS 962.96]
MSRSLRPRNARRSYASSAGLEEDKGEGPSTMQIDDDMESSGSDFTPENEVPKKGRAGGDNDEEDDNISERDELVDSDAEVASARTISRKPSKTVSTKAKSQAKSNANSAVGTSASRASTVTGVFKRQMYALPTPSVHHRHRAVPLNYIPGRVERLLAPPTLFSQNKIGLTYNFTHNERVTDRVSKAWGYNVGSGPLWELVEDRAWFKEAKEGAETEADRRPKVYGNVPVQNWELLDAEKAGSYLPSHDVTTEEGNLRPPPPLACSFGPFDSQTRVEVHMLQTLKMADLILGSSAHIFNAGAPVWGLDWCPIHPNDKQISRKQYLAVAPFPSASHSPEIGVRVNRPFPACIQIWSLSQDTSNADSSNSSGRKAKDAADPGEMKCEMIVCIDSGPAQELRWCPLPSNSSLSEKSEVPRKLGLLSGTFEDGSFSVFVIPLPEDVTPPDHNNNEPVIVRIPNPILRIELEEACCWAVDWANSEMVAIGTTNGVIAVYDVGIALKQVKEALSEPITDLLPTHYLTTHQSAIRALSWIRAPPSYPSGKPRVDENPTVIASGGYDGMECLSDIREGHGSVMNRTRDVINTMAYPPFGGGPVTIDHENIVKAYSASPRMLGRGHMLMEPQGPVWSVAASDYHPQLAVGSADGTCTTTNMLRSTRRGGSVPFFVHKIFHLDYSRNIKEFRMLEKFLPQETQDRPTARSGQKPKEAGKTTSGSTGAWPREVGVQRVTWNSGNGLGASGMLASATACGLCRIDVLWGRWMKDKQPYGGIAGVRMEGDDVDMEDSDSPEED